MITSHIIIEGKACAHGGDYEQQQQQHTLKLELFMMACDLGPTGWMAFSRRAAERCEEKTASPWSASAAKKSTDIVRLTADDISLRCTNLGLDTLADVIESLHTCVAYAIRVAAIVDYYASRTGGVEQEIAEQFHDLEEIMSEQVAH